MKIILPTDFSDNSKEVLNCVLRLVSQLGNSGEIILVHTYVVQQTDPSKVISLNDELKRKSREGLEKLKSEALKKIINPHVTLGTASHFGSVRNVVLQLLQYGDVDLVVLRKDHEAAPFLMVQTDCPLLLV